MHRYLWFLALVFLFVTPAVAADKPNVVMIISDDQAWTDYGFMGHDVIETPHLDQLARESLLYTRGYVPSSLCRPSLMTMITGLYTHQHKVSGNDPVPRSDRAGMLRHVRRLPTLPKLLAEQGYVSLQTGKWWEGNYQEGGFTHGMTHGDTSRGGRHGDEGLKIGREGLQPIFDFIEAEGDKPFFIWYAPFLPHSPHNPPDELFQKYMKHVDSPHVARYYAMCEWFDQTCGELLQYLDEKGYAENTMIVYVTDNGWIQDPQSRQFAPRSKRSPYEAGIRTPIMVRWPGHVTPQRDETKLASSIDLAPTILAACGLKPTDHMPGLNLMELSADNASPRDAIYGEIFDHDVADIERPAASLLYRWCIDGPWKLILPADGGKAELYQLAKDPHETTDLADMYPERVEQLTVQLNHWWDPDESSNPPTER